MPMTMSSAPTCALMPPPPYSTVQRHKEAVGAAAVRQREQPRLTHRVFTPHDVRARRGRAVVLILPAELLEHLREHIAQGPIFVPPSSLSHRALTVPSPCPHRAFTAVRRSSALIIMQPGSDRASRASCASRVACRVSRAACHMPRVACQRHDARSTCDAKVPGPAQSKCRQLGWVARKGGGEEHLDEWLTAKRAKSSKSAKSVIAKSATLWS